MKVGIFKADDNALRCLDGEAVLAKRFSVGVRLRHDVATEFEATAIEITQP